MCFLRSAVLYSGLELTICSKFSSTLNFLSLNVEALIQSHSVNRRSLVRWSGAVYVTCAPQLVHSKVTLLLYQCNQCKKSPLCCYYAVSMEY